LKGQGRRRHHRRVVRSRSEEVWVLLTKLSQCFTMLGRFHPISGGRLGPRGCIAGFYGIWQVLGFARVQAGLRLQGLGGLVFRGAEPRRVTATKLRACPGQCERTREGRKASKQVKPAVRTILPVVTQGNQEACLRAREKGTHSSQGNPGNCVKSAGVGETVSDKVAGGAF
jgi:hypothetical protein